MGMNNVVNISTARRSTSPSRPLSGNIPDDDNLAEFKAVIKMLKHEVLDAAVHRYCTSTGEIEVQGKNITHVKSHFRDFLGDILKLEEDDHIHQCFETAFSRYKRRFLMQHHLSMRDMQCILVDALRIQESALLKNG
jgi:hypothetical protein